MKTYHQPSGLNNGLEFLIDSEWTPMQAMAVVELLDDLRDRITAHYQLPLFELYRELYGPPDEDEDGNDNTIQGDEEEIPF